MSTRLNRFEDRADCCGVQAFVMVRHRERIAELLLCAHHYGRHADALEPSWFVHVDERHLINTKPSASSGVAADDIPEQKGKS